VSCSTLDIEEIFKSIKERFPRFNDSPAVRADWFREMRKYSPAELEAAMVKCRRTWSSAPTLPHMLDALEGREPAKPWDKNSPQQQRSRPPYIERKCTPEDIQADEAKRLAMGLVPCHYDGKTRGWEWRDDCVHVGGRWIRKIDHCMDVLGAERVRAMILERMPELSSRERLAGAVVSDRFDSRRYRTLLAEMLSLCDAPVQVTICA